MPKTVNDWMQEGEELYSATMSDCQEMQTQLSEAQKRLADKQDEANRIGRAIGKPLAVAEEKKTTGSNNLRIAGWAAAILGTAGLLVWLIVSGVRP
jgi:hypothetical protein